MSARSPPRAEPQADGTYRLWGQKIFITWGEHNMTNNIVHCVLARTPGAPVGTRGISLFIVPKFLVDQNGAVGERNAVRCIGLEHKVGIPRQPHLRDGAGRRGRRVGGRGASGNAPDVHHDEQGPPTSWAGGAGRGRAGLPASGRVRR